MDLVKHLPKKKKRVKFSDLTNFIYPLIDHLRPCLEFKDHNGKRMIRPKHTQEQFLKDWKNKGYPFSFGKSYLEKYFNNELKDNLCIKASSKNNIMLQSIDIDAQKINKLGSREGVLAFQKNIDNFLGTNIHWSTSSGGVGATGLLLINVQGVSPEGRQHIAKILDKKLKILKEYVKADIEQVEIKGRNPDFIWAKNKKYKKGDVPVSINDGVCCKLPKNIDLIKLKNSKIFSCQEIHDLNEFNVVKSKKEVSPSQGNEFNKTELLKLNDYRRFAKKQFDINQLHGWKIKNWDITSEDYALFLFIVNNIKCKDGAMPSKTIINKWNWLKNNNYTDRGMVWHRIKTIRNYLSEKGLIDWINENYSFGEISQACRWSLTEEVLHEIDLYITNTKREYAIDSGISLTGEGYNLKPHLAWNPNILTPKRIQEYQKEQIELIFGNY